MPTYRFVHAADLHLDSPFKGLKRVAPEIGEILRKSTFEAFDAIIDLCINEEVDALLVAGDVFDSADRSLAAQLRFVDGWFMFNDDLTEKNLSQSDLSGADLTDTTLSGTILSGGNPSGANLSNLCGANLNGADFLDAELSGANLTGADIDRRTG
jgi:hypothetical protein